MKRFTFSFCAGLVLLIPVAFAQSQSKSQKQAKKNEKAAPDLPAPNFKKCEEMLKKSVVRVQRTTAIGTGFVVGDGTIIVTNDHVVRDKKTNKIEENLTIKLIDGSEQKATVLLAMPHRDVAALKVDSPLEPLILAQENQFMYQSAVMVLGHGEGVENLQNSGKLTDLNEWSAWNTRSASLVFANDTLLLTTDATVHPGHSGSPLATADGLVVGLVTFIERFNAKGNIAVHVSHIRELLEKAAPDMKLATGKLSNVERIRLERMHRSDALAQLAEKAKATSQNGKINSSSLNLFYNLHNAAMRQSGF